MSRLIDADSLYRRVKTECNPYGKPTIEYESGCKVLDWIDSAPTIDAEPVKHGKWTTQIRRVDYNPYHPFETYGACSLCGCGQSINKNFKYCPNCGARMDENERI